MAFTISHTTKQEFRSASAMTQQSSQWPPSEGGGAAWAENAIGSFDFTISLFDEFEVRFGEGFAHLSKDFCTAEVVVATVGCAFECFSVLGRKDFLQS
ncbi:hypothetical protein Spb1_21790 [Planctopirus ephydatiae]|uniref:Uncharacterized protein n=1 Tax=Planctopirus ephydatiae TaxID=2528019 RepID=A0A518GP54_9PLAN|nr:hypothetical protein Spb1_21790 [Planctopirus ephydatiae]